MGVSRPCSADASSECRGACPWAFPFDRNIRPSFHPGNAPWLEFFRERKVEATGTLRDRNWPNRPSCIHPRARKLFRDAKFEPTVLFLTISPTPPPSVLPAELYHRAAPETLDGGACRLWSIPCMRSGPLILGEQTSRLFLALHRRKEISPA